MEKWRANGHHAAVTSASVAAPRALDPSPAAGAEQRRGARLGASIGELLAVGGLTPLLFATSWLLRRWLGLDAADLATGLTFFLAAFVVNDPHFSVTYVLFYRDVRARALGNAWSPAQRARYLVAGFVVPAALAAWAAAALAMRSAAVLGGMIQLMFLLVGWHYVKQGFGAMMVLAARRGIAFRPRERLAILAHCFAGWAYAWSGHGRPGQEVEEKGVVYTTLARPAWIGPLAGAVFAATLVVLAVVLVVKWRREGRLSIFTPLVALLASVWAWSVCSGADPLVRYAVPALHSVQYLYFVGLMERGRAREREGPPWFESSRARIGLLAASALALGWVLFHGAPWALDGLVPRRERASALGATPYFAALYTFVNIHHYFMDGVLWRRENPLTRYLRASR